MFNLDEQPEQSVRLEFVGNSVTTRYCGFQFPDKIPQSITFSNRRLTHTILRSSRIIALSDEIMRALDWKEGDEISWKVYSDRTDFFKVST